MHEYHLSEQPFRRGVGDPPTTSASPSKRGRLPIHSLRTIFDAIFYVLRTGCPWQTIFYHFRCLHLKGT